MNKHWLVLIIFGCFLLEHTVAPWIVPAVWQMNTLMTIQLSFLCVLFSGIYVNRYLALGLGLGFGLLHDLLFYGHMIGVYSFSMGVAGYLTGLLASGLRYRTFFNTYLFVAFGLLCFEHLTYGIYTVFRVLDVSYGWALAQHILPTLLVNLLVVLVVYIPLRSMMEKLALNEQTNTEE